MSNTKRQTTHVASIVVFRDGKILMGQRHDNGKWTLPGGHIEPGEEPRDGALRELQEETGFSPNGGDIECVGSDEVKTKPIHVFAFRCEVEGEPTSRFDPDQEMRAFSWFDPESLPHANDHHVPPEDNVALKALGLAGNPTSCDVCGAEPGCNIDCPACMNLTKATKYWRSRDGIKIPHKNSPDRKEYDQAFHGAVADAFAGGNPKMLRKVRVPVASLYGTNMPVNKDRLRLYTRMAAAGDRLPPVVVKRSGNAWSLLDGNHRQAAAQKAGLTHVDALELMDPPVKKSEALDKMAIKDIQAGADLGRNEDNEKISDYTHLLSPEHQSAGYQLHLHEKPSIRGGGAMSVHAVLKHPSAGETKWGTNAVGAVSGIVDPKGLKVIQSEVRGDHQGGKGVPMYEALYAHSKNKLGAGTVFGDPHSSMASAVHKKVAAKHGLEYQPHANPMAPPRDAGAFDEKLKGYSYTLKSEELEKGLPGVLAAGLLAASPMKVPPKAPAPTQQFQAPKWTPEGLHPEMYAIAFQESSMGKNIFHAPHSKGDYHTAYGAVGMKPVSGHEEYLRNTKLQNAYPDLKDPSHFTAKLKTDNTFYNTVASHMWNRLRRNLGTPERAAFGWRWGATAAQKATPEKILSDTYVQHYRNNALTMNPTHPLKKVEEKVMKDVEKGVIDTLKGGRYFQSATAMSAITALLGYQTSALRNMEETHPELLNALGDYILNAEKDTPGKISHGGLSSGDLSRVKFTDKFYEDYLKLSDTHPREGKPGYYMEGLASNHHTPPHVLDEAMKRVGEIPSLGNTDKQYLYIRAAMNGNASPETLKKIIDFSHSPDTGNSNALNHVVKHKNFKDIEQSFIKKHIDKSAEHPNKDTAFSFLRFLMLNSPKHKNLIGDEHISKAIERGESRFLNEVFSQENNEQTRVGVDKSKLMMKPHHLEQIISPKGTLSDEDMDAGVDRLDIEKAALNHPNLSSDFLNDLVHPDTHHKHEKNLQKIRPGAWDGMSRYIFESSDRLLNKMSPETIDALVSSPKSTHINRYALNSILRRKGSPELIGKLIERVKADKDSEESSIALSQALHEKNPHFTHEHLQRLLNDPEMHEKVDLSNIALHPNSDPNMAKQVLGKLVHKMKETPVRTENGVLNPAFSRMDHQASILLGTNTFRLRGPSTPLVTLTPDEQEYMLAHAVPGSKFHNKISTIMAEFRPDLLAKESVKVKHGVAKHRMVRDIITNTGGTELPPKQLPAGDWSAGRLPNGNISSERLQQFIDAQPEHKYNISHGTWTGDQRHNEESSNVFRLDLTNEHIEKMRQAGVYETYKKVADASRRSSHPVTPHTIGWVRWTGNPHKGVFVDEVQSDFGQSLSRLASMQARETGMSEEEAEAFAQENYPDEHLKKIKEILSGNKHINETLTEGFHQWLRDNGHHKAQVHIHSVESKAPISLATPLKDQPAPAHFNFTYGQFPQKMGKQPARYGDIETQNNPDMQGEPTWFGPVRKSEPLLKMAIKDIRPGTYLRPNEPGEVRRDYSHLLPKEMQKDYSLTTLHTGGGEMLHSVIHHKPTWEKIGYAEGGMTYDGIDPGIVNIHTQLRGKGLGRAMYSAMFAHAFHELKARKVAGMEHSSMAARVHRSITKEHGLKGYDPEQIGAERGEYDSAYGPYEYSLKSEKE